jgi:hypothetical protein
MFYLLVVVVVVVVVTVCLPACCGGFTLVSALDRLLDDWKESWLLLPQFPGIGGGRRSSCGVGLTSGCVFFLSRKIPILCYRRVAVNNIEASVFFCIRHFVDDG